LIEGGKHHSLPPDDKKHQFLPGGDFGDIPALPIFTRGTTASEE
jgi:hypothetical protein